MMLKGIACMVAGLAISSAASGGVPGDFRFSMPYIPGATSTVWEIPGKYGKLHTEYGKHHCVFLDDLEVPAERYEDPWSGELEWRCPDVAVRHLAEILMVREGGRCGGFSCQYDHAYPGPQYVLSAGPVSHCPDIIVTTVRGGQVRVVGAKYYERGDDMGRYVESGVPVRLRYDISHLEMPEYFGECADDIYRRQVDFYRGPDTVRRNTKVRTHRVDAGWDGR